MPSILRYRKRCERSFHGGAVTSMSLDPHGNILAVGSLDGIVSIWDVNSGIALHCINAHSPILSLAWSSGPKGFIFGCENGILVSVLLEKAFIRSMYFHAHSRPIHCISPSLNETRLISGAFDEVIVWERGVVLATHEESWGIFKPIPQPTDKYSQSSIAVQVTSVNWLFPRGSDEEKHKFVVSSYLWHGVLCWDLASLSVVWRLPNPDCLSLVLAPDSSLAVLSRSSHAIEVHDIASRRLIQAIPGNTQSDLVSPPVAFAHDGFAVVTGGQGKAFVWDIEHGDQLQVLDHGGSCRIRTLTTYFSDAADKFIIATGTDEGKDSRIVLWDAVSLSCPDNDDRPSGNWPMWPWVIFGTAALLLSWRWMGYP